MLMKLHLPLLLCLVQEYHHKWMSYTYGIPFAPLPLLERIASLKIGFDTTDASAKTKSWHWNKNIRRVVCMCSCLSLILELRDLFASFVSSDLKALLTELCYHYVVTTIFPLNMFSSDFFHLHETHHEHYRCESYRFSHFGAINFKIH